MFYLEITHLFLLQYFLFYCKIYFGWPASPYMQRISDGLQAVNSIPVIIICLFWVRYEAFLNTHIPEKP